MYWVTRQLHGGWSAAELLTAVGLISSLRPIFQEQLFILALTVGVWFPLDPYFRCAFFFSFAFLPARICS